MWRAQNAFMLLSLIVALWSAAVAQPGVTPEHRPTPPDSDEQRIADLVVASRILVQEGVLDSFGHVTVRSLNNPNHYFMPRAMPPALVTAKDIVELNLDSVTKRHLGAMSALKVGVA
jgi:HCOMODA/2-hydroxy-3-carboxy-muconic semialdehyde decarboxylase